MDGVSAAASVIAVGSVAVQLADSVKKLRDFWCSVKDAPHDVRAIAGDLEVLSCILAEISLETKDQSPSTEAALLRCINGTKPLAAFVEDLEPGFESKSPRTRKWSALKTAFKGEKIKKYQSSLEGLKTSLILAQQSHYGLTNRRQHEVLQLQLNQSIQAISESRLQNSSSQNTTFSTNLSSKSDHIRALSQEVSHIMSAMPKSVHVPGFEKKIEKAFERIFEKLESETSDEDVNFAKQRSSLPDNHIAADSTLENRTPRRQDWIFHTMRVRKDVLKNALGTIYVRSRMSELKSRYVENQYQYEHETSFALCPAWWLVKVGFTYVPRFSLFSSTIQGWKHTLNSFRSVPDNALIFEFCTTGNLSGVQALLARGEASVKDVDSTGRTALHFAAEGHQVQICKLLISEGADKNVPEWNYSGTPLLVAANSINKTICSIADCRDTIRLFADTMDFSHSLASGWETLTYLFLRYTDPFCYIDRTELTSLMVWILHLSASDFKEKQSFSILVAVSLSSTLGALEVDSLLSTINDNPIEVKSEYGHYSALHYFIAFGSWNSDMSFGLKSILNKGADLHFVGYDCARSPMKETPTSLAMYSSFVFMHWRNALKRLSTNLESFVEDEVQQSPLKDDGWDRNSLLALFHCDIQPDCIPPEPGRIHHCDDCSTMSVSMPVELSWREWLNRFKQKTNAKISSHYDESSGAESDRDDGEISSDDESSRAKSNRGDGEILSDDECSGADSDRSDGKISEQNSSSLEVEETILNESCEREEVVDETASSDLYESETETETFGAYFGDGARFVCMRCYVKRGYGHYS